MITSGSNAAVPAPGAQPSAVVIDTNVALDWLAFADPRTDRLAHAVEAGLWRWCATAGMREELADVLDRPAFVRFDAAAILARWDALTTVLPLPPRCALTCGDPDDQVFIDLAMSLPAVRLLSRDKALLALRRPASAIRALEIGSPEELPSLR